MDLFSMNLNILRYMFNKMFVTFTYNNLSTIKMRFSINFKILTVKMSEL